MKVFLVKNNGAKIELATTGYARMKFVTEAGTVLYAQLHNEGAKLRISTDGTLVIEPIACNVILLHREGYLRPGG